MILTVLNLQLKAQHYPDHYFTPPLDTALILIGTFGEIRPNHFHTGIDLSTNQQEGKEVKAAADGYVSRIKISAGGFGKALYVTHPNGYVTVYAHLKKFRGDIQQLVLKNQYEQKSYEIELQPKPKEIKVKKHETIAFSGSTGETGGPHLHFEIRDEVTEEPINPLLFGLKIQDTIAPVISNIRIFPVAGEGILNSTDTAVTFIAVGQKDETTGQLIKNRFTVNIPDYIKAIGTFGFGIEATDHQQNSDAVLGIYSVSLKIDSEMLYEYKMDRLNFNDLRYVNAHIDYRSKLRDNLTIQRSFMLPGNHLKISQDTTKKGYITFLEEGAHTVEFNLTDFNGNKSTCTFILLSYNSLAENPYQPVPEDAVPLTLEKGIAIHKTNVDIVIPAGAVYEKCWFTSSESTPKGNAIAKIFHVGDRFVPIHTSITVGIKPQFLADTLKSKAFLVSLDNRGGYIYEGGSWAGNFLTAKVRHFGDFTIAVDTIPPGIAKDYYPGDSKTPEEDVIRFRIIDNLSGVKSYNVTVDGKWMLMEYNKKENLITGNVVDLTRNSMHHVEVEVTDEKGNVARFVDDFKM